MKTGRSVTWLFATASMVCLAVMAAPVLAASAHPAAATLLYLLFAPACHQLPARSLHLLGYPLAVCARCTGIYFGAWLASLAALAGGRLRLPRHRWASLAAVLMAADVLTELAGLRPPIAWLRFSTGVFAGVIGGAWVLYAACRLVDEWRRPVALSETYGAADRFSANLQARPLEHSAAPVRILR